MTIAKVSQVVAEVIRKNTDVKARVAQAVIEVIRIPVINPNARVSQVVTEVISAERTLAASLSQGVTLSASIDSGTQLAMTANITVSMDARIELGSEFAQVEIPISIAMTAPLQATALFSATMPVSLTMDVPLEEGVELYLSNLITTSLRASLTVHPESQVASRFFLLF